MQLDVSFLSLAVIVLGSNEAYIASLVSDGAVNVVNDRAEHNVKLISDFIDTARDDEHFQNVLQVVEIDRKAASNL